MRRPVVRWAIGLGLASGLLLAAAAAAQELTTPNGRELDPIGRMTPLGAFPTGGALTPDGRFYWVVDAGRGANAVRVVEVGTGEIVATLPIPGGYVGVAFAPDGKRAYVSGQPADSEQPPDAIGVDGDVIHVFAVDRDDGSAREIEPIELPGDTRDGAAAADELPPASGVNAWPEGLAVSPDGRFLVVALGQADQAAIVELASGETTLADVGRYPYGVAIDRTRPRAYVTNERDGTVSVISIPDGDAIATITVAGPGRAGYPHPEGLAVDPDDERLYVAVTDRDRVAVVDTKKLEVIRGIDVGRRGVPVGSAPVNVGVAPDGDTLYVANAGEDAVVAVALERRPPLSSFGQRRRYPVPRAVKAIGHYRRAITRARKQLHRRSQGSAEDRRKALEKFRHRATKLKRRFLHGDPEKACGGPSRAQDRRYGKRVLRAYEQRQRARRRARRLDDQAAQQEALAAASRRFRRVTGKARSDLPRLKPCLPAGSVPGTPRYAILGRFPTAAYTTDVEVTPDGESLVWLASRGVGTGPNPDDESIKELLKGRAGVLERPTDKEIKRLTPRADRAVLPANAQDPPAGTPVLGPGGGPSQQIKHVFYIVRENRTYDQIFGSEPRGEGDPSLQLFDDNGVPGPTGGVTPNAHALSREFSLLDNVMANSEESTAGHKITAGGYVNDYTLRYSFANRGRKGNPDIYPIGNPPNGFIFDQAVRQSVGLRVYGELGAGNQPFANEGRPTYPQVQLNTDPLYPSQIQGTCRGAIPYPPGTPNSVRCTADSGTVGTTAGPPATQSRVRTFATQFQTQVTAGTVPAFNYLILFNDHTDGTTPGVYTPRANLADNDLALGQVVELISQSPIWEESAIFVVEDDSQDGADHVDAHRMPAFVISPWAKHGGQVISNRYDHYSFLRTIELILGLDPLSINDALATPLYDAFISGTQTPDVEGTRYTAIQPEVSLTETNPANAANAELSAAMPFDQVDRVPQRISDKILWQSIFGADATVPPAGPNASPIERARAVGAMRRFRAGRNVRSFLMAGEEAEDELRHRVTARILGLGTGLSPEQALERLEGESEEEEEAEAAEEG